MWKNAGWLAMGSVLLWFILRKPEDEAGPSYEALNRTIEELQIEE